MNSVARHFGFAMVSLAIATTVSAGDKDPIYVVRQINGGLCTTSKGIGVQPGWERCSGPYATQKPADDWLTKHQGADSTCKKEECDYKPKP